MTEIPWELEVIPPEGFQWVRPLGKGGMGTVWLVQHHTGEQLALKLLTHSGGQRDGMQDQLLREARAMARLCHRNVIGILDHGTLAVAEGDSGTSYPFLLMELATHTLADVEPARLKWPTAKQILHEVLDGLAHAHSRGVIHRDLKPANVLLVEEGGQFVCRLSDFGIAEVLREPVDLEPTNITGTPRYMAPEQILGDFAAQGPWSDLYSLGCLAHFLVTGAPPFCGTLEEVLVGHLEAPRPPLVPLIEVPEGLEDWVHRLLARSAEARFAYAADAAQELGRLRLADEERYPRGLTLRGAAEEEESDEATLLISPFLEEEGIAAGRHDGGEYSTAAAIPQSWHGQDERRRDQLPGVGQGLFSLVEIPFVAREDLRDQLWNQLRDTHHLRRPHLALAQGQPGVGKTRLALWVAQRAHEVGVASYLHVSLSSVGSEVAALAAALRAHLMIPAGDRDAALERIYDLMRRRGGLDSEALYESLSFVELLLGARGDDPFVGRSESRRFRFESPEARWHAWLKLLQLVAKDRSLVLVIDDLCRSSEMQELLCFLLQKRGSCDLPLFVIATDSDHGAPGPMMQEICSSPWTAVVDVAPLSLSDHRALLGRVLGLSGTVVDQILSRTGGNPLFALQLVGDWVDRGILVSRGDGFVLVDEAEVPVPVSLTEVLVQRFCDVIGAESAESMKLQALEIAALLGSEVAMEEWRHLLDHLELDQTTLLFDLEERGLVTVLEDTLRFSQGVLQEALEMHARQCGRWRDHHALCASLLEGIHPTPDHVIAGRRVHHLLACGDLGSALPLAHDVLTHYLEGCRYRLAEELFAELRKQVGSRELTGMERRGFNQCTRVYAGVLQMQARFQEVDDLVTTLMKELQERPDSGLEIDLLILRARQARLQRLGQEARPLLARALEKAERLGDGHRLADVRYNLAWILRFSGDFEEASKLLIDAMYFYRKEGRDWSLATAQTLFGNVLASTGDPRALVETHRALKATRRVSDKSLEASCLNNLGDLYRHQGELREAEKIYSHALALNHRWGLPDDIVLWLNLAWTYLEAARFTDAHALLTEVQERARQRPGYVFIVELGILWSLAGSGGLQDQDELIKAVTSSQFMHEIIDNDVALALESAGRMMAGAGARAILRGARSQWEQMGRNEKVKELDNLLGSRADLMVEGDDG